MLAPADLPRETTSHIAFHGDADYERLLGRMQTLRGRLYLEDGAISKSEMQPDGRHVVAGDRKSWHLLTLNSAGEVVGGVRFLKHRKQADFSELNVSDNPLAKSDNWGHSLRRCVEKQLLYARVTGRSYLELGGWAMDHSIRRTTACARSVLAIFAWSRLIGGTLGITTATERNGSASILRRLGGRPLAWDGSELPGYFDPRYNCQMQILQFDSSTPNPKYEEMIEQLRMELADVPVVYATKAVWQRLIEPSTNTQTRTLSKVA